MKLRIGTLFVPLCTNFNYVRLEIINLMKLMKLFVTSVTKSYTSHTGNHTILLVLFIASVSPVEGTL